MSAELDPESGAETAAERALLARRPRSGAEYESALAMVLEGMKPLAHVMSEAERAREAEVMLDISWLAAEGVITVAEMSARTERAAERHIARVRGRSKGGSC